MKESNFDGSRVILATGTTTKLQLDRAKLTAILRQVELELPGSTILPLGKKTLVRSGMPLMIDACRLATRQNIASVSFNFFKQLIFVCNDPPRDQATRMLNRNGSG